MSKEKDMGDLKQAHELPKDVHDAIKKELQDGTLKFVSSPDNDPSMSDEDVMGLLRKAFKIEN
jgi:hypothetical protein